LVKYMNNSPGENGCYIRLYSLGGVIKEFPHDYSEYYHRNTNYIISITGDSEKKDDAALYKNWVEEVFQYVMPLTNGSYVDFSYAELENYGYAYYGRNYPKLKKLKETYGPDNIFKFQQSIKPNCLE
jgi:hypothetical protein